MTADPFAEVFNVGTDKALSEAGGGHSQKGVEFQRHWAVMRMFELDDIGATDFLILFESIQDIAVLDSETAPSEIRIYQLKKKDRGEWGWVSLTALSPPPKPATASSKAKITFKKQRTKKPLTDVKDSPLGKLYACVRAFQTLNSTGHFLSNARCDLPLAGGGNVATSLPVALSNIEKDYADIISNAFTTFHHTHEPAPDLSRIFLEHVTLQVDDPGTHLVGFVHKFLERRSARHAGQARALVDALLAKIGPLGAKTDSCQNFSELRKERGYSKAEFHGALGDLEGIPDLLEQLETWLGQLQREGMGVMEIMSIRAAAAAIFRRQVIGRNSAQDEELLHDCDTIISSYQDTSDLRPRFDYARSVLALKYSTIRPAELLAHFAIRALSRCAAPI